MIHFRRIITLFITAALLLPYLLTVNAEESYDNIDGYYIYNVMYSDSISDYGAFYNRYHQHRSHIRQHCDFRYPGRISRDWYSRRYLCKA